MKKKLFTAISLGILSAFASGVLTASAAELKVEGGPGNMKPEQKAEWVDEIDGGYTAEGDANNNTVYISSEVEITSNLIAGGYTENGDTNGNKVTFDGVTFTAAEEHGVYGGYSYQGNSCDNYVEIENSNIDAENSSIVGGGLYAGNGEIVNNKVFIDRSSLVYIHGQ